MADFEIFSELCAYQSLKKMRGNNEKRGRVTQVDRAAWHRTEEEKLLMMIKIFCVKIQRWQSDLVSLRSNKHQSEAGQIKDPTAEEGWSTKTSIYYWNSFIITLAF